jgi:hypothetical protein
MINCSVKFFDPTLTGVSEAFEELLALRQPAATRSMLAIRTRTIPVLNALFIPTPPFDLSRRTITIQQ